MVKKQKIIFPSLDTPALLLDMDKLEANIKEMSQMATIAGVKLRPHIKVHECAALARMQIEAGACGIEVGNVAQAEGMVNEGIIDVKIAHPGYYGDHKGESLKRILSNPDAKISVVIDMLEQAEQLSQIGKATGRKISVNIKIDTSVAGGFPRHGVQPDESALTLAKKASQLPGVEVTGIYAHEMGVEATEKSLDSCAYKTLEIMSSLAKMFMQNGIKLDDVSVGASPTFRYTCKWLKDGKFREVNEIHPGNCVIGSPLSWKLGGNKKEDCALSILVTVTSTSHSDWFIINAGYKTFSHAYLAEAITEPNLFWEYRGEPLPIFGFILERPDLRAAKLFAESAKIYYMDVSKSKLNIGDRLKIVPNDSICPINTKDKIYGVRKGVLEREFLITGRGLGN